jgi:hypothetical protein
VLVIVLCVIGVGWALWRRRWLIAAFGVSAPIALDYFVSHSGPWVEFKAYTVTATMFLAMAFVGAGALIARRRGRLAFATRVMGWSCAGAVTAGVLYGNALTYHDVALAPAARYRDLAAIGARFAGQGPTLIPIFDEYTEYFLRRERAYDLVRPLELPLQPGISIPAGFQYFAFDLNQFTTPFVEDWPLIVLPREPVVSRPPANYVLAARTHYFDVWRRVQPPTTVMAHLPLSGSPVERTPAFCQAFRRMVRNAGPSASIAYAQSPLAVRVLPTLAVHPHYWRSLDPEQVRAYGAGSLTASFSVPVSGNYDLWLFGSVERTDSFTVDGRPFGSVGNQERYPGQYLAVGSGHLAAGAHVLRMSRSAGNLGPGNGDGPDTLSGLIGPIVFSPRGTPSAAVHVAAAGTAARVCAARVGYQWLEVLRPAPAGGQLVADASRP